jgi:DNA-binding transcriptional ArsR family regulator
MPITFRITDPASCRWAISPLRETLSAVRLLTQPHRQGYHQPWLRAVAPALSELDLTPLLQVMPRGYNPDFLTPAPPGPSAHFADELALVRRTPAAQVRAELSRCMREQHGRRLPPPAQALVDHPLRARNLLADTLAACWDRLIAPWWPRIHDVLAGDIAYRTRLLADGGLTAVLTDLHEKIHWRHPTLTVDLLSTGFRDVEAGFVLMPSTFEWPNVGVMLDKPWLPTIDYPARGIAALWEPRSDPPAALARLLGQTRATLLAALTEPTSTTALARRCSLPNSTVSEHLTVLREADLVTTHRTGRYLQHTRTPLGTQLASPTPRTRMSNPRDR